MLHAKSISVAAGWARPPYINSADHSGFELDLIRAVLKDMGHETTVVYVPHSTTISLLKNGQVDMALTLNSDSGIAQEMLSDVYITYQNAILSLKRHKLVLTSLAQLSDLRVIGFQSAKNVLGIQFFEAVSASSLYFEMADQNKQLELFLQGNVDAIAIDINVFDYLSREMTGSSQFDKIEVHPFFPLNNYRAGFRDKQLKQKFNEALNEYLGSSQYVKLKSTYQIRQVSPIIE